MTQPQLAVPLDQLDSADRAVVQRFLQRRHQPEENGHSSQHVQAMLRALEQEWKRTGGFDKAYMDDYLARWRAENAA